MIPPSSEKSQYGESSAAQLGSGENTRTIEDYELEFKVSKLLDEKYKQERELNQETVRMLQISQQSLKESNDSMRAKLDSAWDRPRTIFQWAAIILTVVFGANLANQAFTLNDFRNQTSTLREQTVKADERWTTFSAHERKYSRQVERDQVRGTTSLRILTLLDIARDQLMHRKNYDRALDYANEAQQALESLDFVEEAKRDLDFVAAGSLAKVERQFIGAISLIKTECYFLRGNPQDLQLLHDSATSVVESGCGCREGNYFLGQYHLLRSEQLTLGDKVAERKNALLQFLHFLTFH